MQCVIGETPTPVRFHVLVKGVARVPVLMGFEAFLEAHDVAFGVDADTHVRAIPAERVVAESYSGVFDSLIKRVVFHHAHDKVVSDLHPILRRGLHCAAGRQFQMYAFPLIKQVPAIDGPNFIKADHVPVKSDHRLHVSDPSHDTAQADQVTGQGGAAGIVIADGRAAQSGLASDGLANTDDLPVRIEHEGLLAERRRTTRYQFAAGAQQTGEGGLQVTGVKNRRAGMHIRIRHPFLAGWFFGLEFDDVGFACPQKIHRLFATDHRRS